jgi:aspartokinase/homoserine dehydrogenase 1
LAREVLACHAADLLHAQSLVGSVTADLLELISGLGEVWSSRLVDAAVRARGAPSTRLDAREVLIVDKTELGAIVQWDASQRRLAQHLAGQPNRTIVTGFVARTTDGRITTLGRNGSDYSGAIFAALFSAKELHIWTDVDGVLSADPRLVPEAVLDAAVLRGSLRAGLFRRQGHPPADHGCRRSQLGIPIFIRNTFNPEHPGTRIAVRVMPQPESGEGRHPFTGPWPS